MFQKVDLFLDQRGASLATTVPVIATLQQQLKTQLQAVFDANVASQIQSNGYTQQKADAREALEASLLKISRSATAYATLHQQHALRQAVHFVKSKLAQMRDNDLYTTATHILLQVTPVIRQLADFALQPADLQTAETLRDAFFRVIQLPKTIIGQRAVRTQAVLDAMDAVAATLNERLDVVMGIFELSEPTLYEEYRAAREIDTSGGKPRARQASGKLAPNEIATIGKLDKAKNNKFILSNTGKTTLFFGMSDDEKTFVGAPVEVAPQREMTLMGKSFETIGAVLIVSNPNAQMGEFKTTISG